MFSTSSLSVRADGASRRTLVLCAACAAGLCSSVRAAELGNIFYIELENHNWTQPDPLASGSTSAGFAQLKDNPGTGYVSPAKYLNSLISTNQAVNPVWGQVSYASAYHSVLASPSGSPPSVHPSEPNYIWQEAGSNLGVTNDNDPYGSGNSVANIQNYLSTHPSVSGQNLSTLLQNKGITWKSYQEDTDLSTAGVTEVNGNQAAYNGHLPNNGNNLTGTPVSSTQYTVPLASFAGTSSNYTNPYNQSHQYDYAAKHNPQVFFTPTNGGNNATTSNTMSGNYAPLQQLQTDLNNNTVARYNIITPNQFNDMHTALATDFTYNGVTYTAGSDANRIAVGDNFLSQVVPMIMASQAYQNNGAIVIWTDETEGNNRDLFDHTLAEIVISPLAKGTIDLSGVYNSTLNYTHSSDLASLQEIFQVPANTLSGYLNDAANPTIGGTMDLSDLFLAGVIPSSVPEPSSVGLLAAGLCVLARRTRRKSA
ncbi:MAG TPA: alkaline phosphatase family protein [Tepidisphaeraceae bacterium]|nr:alkaline phosphatase family protein [Tepidisphaeraceae bacterium]